MMLVIKVKFPYCFAIETTRKQTRLGGSQKYNHVLSPLLFTNSL